MAEEAGNDPRSESSHTALTIAIPSHFRPSDLKCCMDSLIDQLRPDDRLLVALSIGDAESLRICRGHELFQQTGRSFYVSSTIGVVAKLNELAARCDTKWIQLIDDDTQVVAGWRDRITRAIDVKCLGAYGGRDIQVGVAADMSTVGVLSRSGRLVGNHERGVGPKREVDFLKGANFLCLANLFPIPAEMSGKDAEPHWEIYLCEVARRRHLAVIYDPEHTILHFPGQRREVERSAHLSLARIYARNAVLAHLIPGSKFRALRVAVHLAVAGRAPAYGVARAATGWVRKEIDPFAVYGQTMRGLMDAVWASVITKHCRNHE